MTALRKAFIILSVCTWAVPAAAQDTTAPPDELDRLVTAYFTEPNKRQRAGIAAKIGRLVDDDVQQVIDAVGRVQLWPAHRAGTTRFELRTGHDRITPVEVRLPEEYDATKRYPLIVALHGKQARGRDALAYVRRILGDRAEDFIIAGPTNYRGTWFTDGPSEAGDPPALLLELRKRFHLDTERVYAVGISMGGHAAFTLATMYADELASAVAIPGTLVVGFPQAQDIILENLTNTPVLAIWGENDRLDDAGAVAPDGGIAGNNRRLMEVADEMDLPFTGIELPGVGHTILELPAEPVREFLQMRRDPAPWRISHWFRYPVQGRCGWLRQAKFSGRPWRGNQLTIVTRRRSDFEQYATETIKRKLAYLGGRIRGQQIDVTTGRTTETHVLLHDELINLDQPILLKVNGKKRYEGRVTPRISTLLETAYQDWDFQRLYTVRLVVGRRSLARQD
jgi:pimeloyl-ACP methyl ester carboxylesterase